MKISAIIAEYNPIHSGHIYHIRRTLEISDKIIVIMSGSFTQRGDVAIDNKYARARNAILAGADMVIELPTIYAVSPADKFAYGAIKTLKELPIQYLSFGSESGNIDTLHQALNLLDNETRELKQLIKHQLDKGLPLVKARAYAFNKLLPSIDLSPNNTLAIEYLRCIKGTNISPHTILREGNPYSDMSLSGKHLSATAIREAIYLNQYDKVANHLPYSTNYNLNAPNNLGQMILYRLNNMTAQEIKNTFDVSEGLENRIINSLSYNRYVDFIENLKTKRYTMARLKRILISCLLDITDDLYNNALESLPYINILAVRQDSKDLISMISTPNIYTKPSDYHSLSQDTQNLMDLDILSHKIACVINEDTSNLNSMQVIS